MRSLILGLNFLLAHTNDEIFTYTNKEQKFIKMDESPFPYFLVSVGSGVSIIKVTGEDSYERVSGSAIGGGTFWGLCRLLTGDTPFEKLRDGSMFGDNENVDLLVQDIYCGDYRTMGLPGNLIASSFGKVGSRRTLPEKNAQTDLHFNANDVSRSLFLMISTNLSQIAFLNAQLHGVKKMFFTGGFVRDNPTVWNRLTEAINFWSKGEMEAMFLRHDGYLGVLGALLAH